MDKLAIKEGLKELARLAFLGALTAALGWGAEQLTEIDPTSVYYLVGTLVLRAVDSYVHHNKSIKANGISPI